MTGFLIGDRVNKISSIAGYSGPGKVVAMFETEEGDRRYVVAHRIEGGQGNFFHIYSPAQLMWADGVDGVGRVVDGVRADHAKA